MAVMSTKKTGTNITSWEYYVVGKKDWNRYENILLVETQSPTSIFTDIQGKNTSKEIFPALRAGKMLISPVIGPGIFLGARSPLSSPPRGGGLVSENQ